MIPNDHGLQILQQLMLKQHYLKLNDSEFARELQVPRPTWVLTANRYRPLGPTIAQAARLRFPEMDDLVVDFLLAYRVRTRTDDLGTLQEATR